MSPTHKNNARKTRGWLFALGVFFVAIGLVGYHLFGDNVSENQIVEQEPKALLDRLLTTSVKAPSLDSIGEGVESVQSKSRLTPAEIHEIESWNNSRDYTSDVREIYEAYDDATIMDLAAQGDRYALEEGFNRKAREGDARVGLQMLHQAATQGSTSALISAGFWAAAQLDNIVEYGVPSESAIELYGLQNSNEPVEEALARIAGTYYIAAMLRGNIHMSSQYIENLQQNVLGRDFTAEERRNIFAGAEGLYDELEYSRANLGMEPFDNQYPPSYAEFYGIPTDYPVFRELVYEAIE